MRDVFDFAKFFIKNGADSMPNTYDGNMKLQKLVDYLSNDKLCSINYPLIKPE